MFDCLESSVIIIALLLFSILLYLNYQKLKQKSTEIDNFNALRKTFLDADNRLIYLKDEKLRYIFVNRAMEQFLQRSSSGIIGRDDFALIDKEFAALRSKTDLEALEKKTLIVDEGKWNNRVYRTTKFPVRLLNGHYGVGAYIEDVTEAINSKKNEEKTLLRNSILVDVFSRTFKTSRDQLDYVLGKALQLTESKLGYIYLYDDQNRELIINSWSKDVMAECAIAEKQIRSRLEETGIWGEVVRQRKPIVVNDYRAPNPKKRGYPEGHVQLTKFMSVPVIVENKIVAVVGLANKEDDYDDNDIYQIAVLMTGVWHAKERRERDIELREANLTLQENQEKLQLILDSTAEAIYGIDLNGNCTFCNASCIKMLGYGSQDELIGKNMHWQIHHSRPDGSPISLEECRIFKAFRIGEGMHAKDEVFWRADGTSFVVEYYSYPQLKDGKVIGAVVTFMDITERKKAEEKIRYISFHDSLTGLYNRTFFEEELKRLDTERNLPISIIMGDMNGLKLTNDIFGHTAGDMLLKKIAAVFRRVCRADDIIARTGGDEFVILLPKTKLEKAEEIAARIKKEFAKEHVHAIKGNISMGCSAKVSVVQNILETLKDAEDRMYLDKTLHRKNIDSTLIETIIENLHQKSPREKEHARRVSDLCEKIGIAMQLPATEINMLKAAGFLHDIGKIILEESVLQKEGPLTEQERKEMEQHPVAGYRILNSFAETMDLAESVLAHHERWDGTGYPKGLAGNKIPKLARIIAVAESYDAMLNRTNGGALNKENAVDNIRKMAGSGFDPDVVAVFLEIAS